MKVPQPSLPPGIVFRPHDLLWLRARWAPEGALPEWAVIDWPVVVRRAEPQAHGQIPVGVRGRDRAQRHASWIAAADVVRAVSPEALAKTAWHGCLCASVAALEALRTLGPYLDEIGLPWGPAGSTGFALATGAPVLRPDSDLDLLVRAPSAPSAAQVAGLKALQGRVACRLDIQIDTGAGGFALNEWLAARPQVLLKTARGPVLVADPWQGAHTESIST
jgi:phosphoribosyl-dephospho-CoA transferase